MFAIDWINKDGTVETQDIADTYEEALEWKAAYEFEDEEATRQGVPVPAGEFRIREILDADALDEAEDEHYWTDSFMAPDCIRNR